MADDGLIACEFREAGCLFSCTGEAAMARHLESNTSHMMCLLLQMKQLRQDVSQIKVVQQDIQFWKRYREEKIREDSHRLDQLESEHRDLIYWKRQEKEVQEKEARYGASSVNLEQQTREREEAIQRISAQIEAFRQEQTVMNAELVEVSRKMVTQTEHVETLERDATARIEQLTETTNTLLVNSNDAHNKLKELETDQITDGDRLARMKSSMVDLENKVARSEHTQVTFQEQAHALKEQLTTEQKQLQENCASFEKEVKKMKEKLTSLEEHYQTLASDSSEMNSKQADLEGQYRNLATRAAELNAKHAELTIQVEKDKTELDTRQKGTCESRAQLPKRISVIEDLTLRSGIFIWRVTQVSKLLAATKPDEAIYSPFFFSHEKGYKLKLGLCPNGFDKGTGTHLSLYFYICKGPHDEDLCWPFAQNITLEILDLTGGGQNRSVTKEAGEGGEATWQKPVELTNVGHGEPCFLAHTDLKKQPCPYLDNDCLIIRVNLVMSTTPISK